MYNVETARHCLRLIRDIADRGVASSDPDNVGYALGELREVFLETASFENRLFEPAPANKIVDMESLLIELQWFDHFSKERNVRKRLVVRVSNRFPVERSVERDDQITVMMAMADPKKTAAVYFAMAEAESAADGRALSDRDLAEAEELRRALKQEALTAEELQAVERLARSGTQRA